MTWTSCQSRKDINAGRHRHLVATLARILEQPRGLGEKLFVGGKRFLGSL